MAPLLPTPTHPEYPSAHGCLTGAWTNALAAAVHSDHLDVTIPGAMNGGTTLTTSREYNNVQDIQNQIPDARVWIGFHFRNSVDQGLRSATRLRTGHSEGTSGQHTPSLR